MIQLSSMARRKAKNKIPSWVETVRDVLLEIAGTFPRPFETPYQHIRRLHREALGIPEFKKWQYNHTVKYLEKTKQIKIAERDGKLFIRLTKKGKVNALLSQLSKSFAVKALNLWDGKWRLIIWDIPETSSKQRDNIRYVIKTLGFKQVQKSVFISPYPLPQVSVDYLNESGLDKYIRFFRVDKVDNEKMLKKIFDLK